MRKFLVAVCLVSAFTFVADSASARARIGRVVSSKPAPVKTVPKPDAAKAVERPSAPRSWIVVMPRPVSRPAAAPVAAADTGADEGSASFSWAAMPSAESSAPAAATDAAPEKPAAAPSAKPESPAQAPTSMAALNVKPLPKPARAALVQPREAVICYWNRAGQCVP
jgi:hypothetical protein